MAAIVGAATLKSGCAAIFSLILRYVQPYNPAVAGFSLFGHNDFLTKADRSPAKEFEIQFIDGPDVELIGPQYQKTLCQLLSLFWVLFQIEWKQSHAGVGRRKGLAGKLLNFPVVKKMMFVRLRRDLNPLALTMAA